MSDPVSVRTAGATSVIDLPSEVDGTSEAGLASAYDQAAANGGRAVLLNFTAVDYINSTGIALIVGLMARARKESRPLSACGLSEHYREVFEITRLSDFMPIHADEATAIASVGKGG